MYRQQQRFWEQNCMLLSDALCVNQSKAEAETSQRPLSLPNHSLKDFIEMRKLLKAAC